MAFCIDTDSPEYVSLVDGLRDKLGVNAEFEAKRDIYEHGGEFRTPQQVLEKLADNPGPFNPYANVLEGSLEGNKQEELLEKIIEDIKGDATSYLVNGNRVTIPFSKEGKIKTKEAAEKTAERIVKKLKVQYASISPNLFFIDKTVNSGAAIKVNITDVATANYIKQQAPSYFREEEFIEEIPLENTDNLRANEIATKLATRLSEQIGLSYEVLTSAQAKEIDPNYNGEAALFLGDKVYFVGDKLNTKTAFHEYSHPLLRSISIDNNKLFNKLFTDLVSTNEGADVVETVRKLYPELEEGSDRFKEEVLVHALTTAATNKAQKLENSAGFTKVLNNILYAIKQLLRKVFGQKVDVSKLDVDTTLDTLADMLTKGQHFKINTEIISQDDVAAYLRSEKKFYEDMAKIDDTAREKLVDSFYDKVLRQIQLIKKSDNPEAKLGVLINKYKQGELEDIRKNLKNFQTKINTDLDLELEDVEYARQQTKALLKSLEVLKNVTEHIREALTDIAKDVNNKDKILRAEYYRKLISTWDAFMEESKDVGIEPGSDLDNLVLSIQNSLDGAKRSLNNIAEQGATDAVMEILTPTMESMEKTYQNQLKVLQAKLAKATTESARKTGQAAIDRLTQEYNNQKITPNTVKQALKGLLTDENGKIKDASMLNSFFEGYGYNTDQIVGALHLYTKNNVADVTIKAQSQANTFGNTMKPLLEAIGWDPKKLSELGDKLSTTEDRGYVEDGEFKTQKVRVFTNERTGWDIVEAKYRFDIKAAAAKYEETHSKEDKDALALVQANWAKHKREYLHQEYVPEFYVAQDLLTKDEIGREANLQQSLIQNEIHQLEMSLSSETDELLENEVKIGELRRQLRQLSLLRDENGRMKTGRPLEIAERLQEYSEAMKKFYYTEEITGKFQDAYNDFQQALIESGKVPGSDAYNTAIQQWKDLNTRIVIKPEFYEERAAIFQRIEEIMSYLPKNEQAELDISKYWEEILDLTKGYRDQDGQPVGAEMTEEKLKRIKHLQEQITIARDKLATRCGLTKKESYELNEIFEKLLFGDATEADKIRLQVLMDRKSSLGLNRFQRVELNSLYAQLGELQKKMPTDSYVDTLNDWLSTLDTTYLYETFKMTRVTANTAGFILNDSVLNDFFGQSPEFEAWFKDNHISKLYFDQDLGMESERWERTYAWNVVRPIDPAYYETTVVTNQDGTIERVQGLPSMKYYKRLVKNGEGKNEDGTPRENYFTPKIVGKTVDNRGNFLPKLGKAEGAPDDRYVNQEYFRIKKEDPKLFEVLEKMKEFHLKHQEGMNENSRLWYDMPRYRKGIVELAQGKNLLQRIIDRIKEFFQGVKDKYDQGFNWDPDKNLIRLDILDDSSARVPVSGLSNLPLEEASGDIAYTMLRYMMSGEIQNKLIEISPVVNAIQDTVNNPKNAPLLEKMSGNSLLRFTGKKKEEYIRKKVVNNFIEREYHGVINKGIGSESVWAQNVSGAIFRQSSLVYLTLNFPSAIRNAVSAKFQGMVEAIAGQHLTWKSFLSAEVTASKAMGEIMSGVYKPGSKSLLTQMMEVYDPAGKTQKQLGESMTRTLVNDLKTFKWMNDFRRATELQSTLQIFFGMMKNKKVLQDGKYIPLEDAWEINKDGNIQLKPGIDPEEGITYDAEGNQKVGQKFLAQKNEMQQVISNLNGAMRSEESPEGKRYLWFRFVSFLKSWLPAMVINRFGHSGNILKGTSRGRVDYMLGDSKEGFYITFLKTLGKTIRNLGRNLPFMTQKEKAAALRMGAEAIQLTLISLVISLLFDWDPDDKDRYKKLRAKSGALGSDDFRLGGYLEQHMLSLLIQVQGENNQFLPYTAQGIRQYSSYVTDVSSAAFGSNLKTFGKIVQDLEYLATGDDRAYYKRDASEAYPWQEKGNLKLWNHLASSMGISGSQIDPVTALRNYVTMQAKQK